jgi:hypothetical protein
LFFTSRKAKRLAQTVNDSLANGLILEAISKIGFWFKVKAAARFKPYEYIRYFEDLNQAPNAEIGPKDLFEIASDCIDHPLHQHSKGGLE